MVGANVPKPAQAIDGLVGATDMPLAEAAERHAQVAETKPGLRPSRNPARSAQAAQMDHVRILNKCGIIEM
jgi:hypothetical protein